MLQILLEVVALCLLKSMRLLLSKINSSGSIYTGIALGFFKT